MSVPFGYPACQLANGMQEVPPGHAGTVKNFHEDFGRVGRYEGFPGRVLATGRGSFRVVGGGKDRRLATGLATPRFVGLRSIINERGGHLAKGLDARELRVSFDTGTHEVFHVILNGTNGSAGIGGDLGGDFVVAS